MAAVHVAGCSEARKVGACVSGTAASTQPHEDRGEGASPSLRESRARMAKQVGRHYKAQREVEDCWALAGSVRDSLSPASLLSAEPDNTQQSPF